MRVLADMSPVGDTLTPNPSPRGRGEKTPDGDLDRAGGVAVARRPRDGMNGVDDRACESADIGL